MPITQDRMHRLLQAAIQYQTLYHSVIEAVNYEANAMKLGKSPDKALADLTISCIGMHTQGAGIVVAEEKLHYSYTHKKNEYIRGLKANQRAAGVQPQRRRYHAPGGPSPYPIPRTAAQVEAETQALEASQGDDNAVLSFAPSHPPQATPAVPEGTYIPKGLVTEGERKAIDVKAATDLAQFNKELAWFTKDPNAPGATEWRKDHNLPEPNTTEESVQ